MKFNAMELNPKELLRRARDEAQQIYSKESTRHNRSLKEIITQCCYGHAAEQYLIEFQSFENNPEPYQDLIDPYGNRIEVKVTEGEYYVEYVLKRANEARMTSWRKHPDILYVFIGNKHTLDYHLHNIYEWNGKSFIPQTSN